jgi:leucyl aminopeptidase
MVPVWSDGKTVALPSRLQKTITGCVKTYDFKGKWGAGELLLSTKSQPHFVGLIGLGSRAESVEHQAEGVRRGVGRIIREMRRHALRQAAVMLSSEEHAPIFAAAAAEAALLATYRFTDYLPRLQKEQSQRALRQVDIVVADASRAATRAAVGSSQEVLPGVELARHLVDQPGSALSPKSLVEVARTISSAASSISLKVMNRAVARRAGFNAFLAVAQGSTEEPYVIHLTYRPPQPTAHKVVIVGKGITFDSGGLSLKPAQYMEDMKIDMAGAAAVLGLFSVLHAVAPPVEVHGVIATCENMPSGNAYRPGDVLTARNGKTIEVVNTDAEGRITLADALSYAVDLKPTAIIDLATLTGACMVALGESVAGLWTTSDELSQQLLVAARKAGEGLEDLPMVDEYHQFIESRVADLKNAGSNHPMAGAITAAMFLREFVDTTPWAHLDIAGPAFVKGGLLPYYVHGATGYGIRTLMTYLKTLT